MNIWHEIEKERISPEKFTCVIEIQKGFKNKYELDKSTGMLRLDRVLYTSTHYHLVFRQLLPTRQAIYLIQLSLAFS